MYIYYFLVSSANISVVIYFLSAGPAITTHLALSALPPPLTPSLRRGCPVAGPYQLFWSAPAPGPRLESQTYYITSSRYCIVSWIFIIATNDLMVALCVIKIKCSLRIILRHCSIFHPHPFFVGHNLRCWFITHTIWNIKTLFISNSRCGIEY